ncbi:mandelate racemase/muconate lactonizing enzyme family protein [Rhizobium sp. GN54]|uniref:mandelate racemase/muconate lactonizing enzyme family protein n=1 Tax=Rhizobium sp. GN54 TaxID=2898150 RepID=UPI001E5C57D8|nr:mandelate racemase/muconate lactonizing enzyme family protein [Rhizobium sp. GN54]MCD2185295.1 mandelate racemase/muconate lactonizing enzyme family protein [Rhizobium sp. GN54]
MPRVAGNALRTFRERASLLVKVTTAGGISGWGETWAYPAAASELIRTMLAPKLFGMDITNPRAAQARLLEAAVPDRRGQVHMAVSALDIALWDGYGRTVGKPIHELLGGALRSSIKAYASGPLLPAGDDRYDGFDAAIGLYAELGFSAVKIRIGIDEASDLSAIRRARTILGEDAMLMADLNEASTVRDAVSLAYQAADAKLAWLEEPVRHDDLDAYRRLAQMLPLPLAGGESFCGVQAFAPFIAAGTLDIVQPDLAICGGLTEGIRVAGLADAFDVPVAPHVWGSAINFLASLQYAATLLPGRGRIGAPVFEYDMSFNPLRERLYDPRPDGKGEIAVPDGAGLGIAIDIERLADYVTDHWVLEA